MSDKNIDIQQAIRDAETKMSQIFASWMVDDAVMLNIMCMLDKKADPSQDTVGIDVRGRVPILKYNPNFINKVSKERLELSLAVEGFKVLLRHCTTRLRDPKQLSALASSVTITQLMNNELKNILAGMDEFAPTPEQYGLKSGEFYEHYFRKLLEKSDEMNEQIQKIWNSMTDEQKQEMIDQHQQQGQGQPQDGQGQPQDGQGQPQDGQGQPQDGQGQPQDGQGDAFKDFDSSDDAMKEYFNPNGTSNDGWGKNDLFDADVQDQINKCKDSARQWGKFTGNAQAEIVAANTPKISYKEVIRRFGRSVLTEETISSRMKVSRRYGLDLPGYRRAYKSRIIFAVDVSGSMSDEDLKEGFAVINSCLKHSEIICVQFDTAIKKVERKFKRAKQTFKVYGRGGTDYNEVLEFADKERCDGIVVYTDGEASVPKQPKAKVLWLLHTENAKPPTTWGYSAKLDRFEDSHTW